MNLIRCPTTNGKASMSMSFWKWACSCFFFTSLTLFNIFLFKAYDGQSKEEKNIAEAWVKFCLFFYIDIIIMLTLKKAVQPLFVSFCRRNDVDVDTGEKRFTYKLYILTMSL